MNTHLGADAREAGVSELGDLVRLNASPRLLLASSDVLSGDEISVALRGILDDAWEQAGAGPGFTFPADEPDRRLDFVFYNPGRPGFRVIAAKTLKTTTSMHVPLMVEFELVVN